MSNRRAITVLAAVVLSLGLAVGFWPLSLGSDYRAADGSAVTCGSAFQSDTFKARIEDTVADAFGRGPTDGNGLVARCESKLSGQRTTALILAGLGGLALAFMALTNRPSPEAAAGSAERRLAGSGDAITGKP